MIAQIIGITMIVSVFAGMFGIMVKLEGIKFAMIIYGIVILLVGWVSLSSYLVGGFK